MMRGEKRPIVIIFWSVVLAIQQIAQLAWLIQLNPHRPQGTGTETYYVFSHLPGLVFTAVNVGLAVALFGLSRWALLLLLVELAFGLFVIALHWPHVPMLSYLQVVAALAFAATVTPYWNKMNWRPLGEFGRDGFEGGQNA